MSSTKLKEKAFELVVEAKLAKKEKKFDDAADNYLKAAKIFKEVGDEKNWKHNCANYYSTIAKTFFVNREYEGALKSFKNAEKLFLELNSMKEMRAALYCANYYMKCLFFKTKQERKSFQEYLEHSELYQERYKIFSDEENYIDIQINFYKVKSITYRFQGKYELAEIWAKKCYELAEVAFKFFQNEIYENEFLYTKHMYLELKGKQLENEGDFEGAAEYYKESGLIIKPLNFSLYCDKFVNSYKCNAIANKYNKEFFIKYIDKAIEYARKRHDNNQIHYLMGLKYDHLVIFTDDLDEKIQVLKEAKTNYYLSSNKDSANMMEYFLSYLLSKKYLKNGEYQKSIDIFDKAISYSENAIFPNIVPSRNILINEKYLHEFYFHISNCEFSIASEMINKWLNTRNDIQNTKKYKFYEISGFCCELLSSDTLNDKDLYLLENYIHLVRESKLGFTLYDICSLVHSYVTLWIHNIRESEFLKSIKLELISKITNDDVASYVERSLKVKNAIEGREWLSQLPQKFGEKFDKSIFHLEDSVKGFENGAFIDFYKLIENFIRIIVEFNAKTLWEDEFKTKLEDKIAQININKKPFKVFAMGDLINSIKILKGENAKFCENIPKSTLDLLDYHIPIRNSLAHELDSESSKIELSKIDIIRDTSEIIYSLLPSFPTLIEIKDIEKKPWYSAEIQWSQYPKRITINYEEKNLNKGIYYAEPMLKVLDNRIHPEIMIKT